MDSAGFGGEERPSSPGLSLSRMAMVAAGTDNGKTVGITKTREEQ